MSENYTAKELYICGYKEKKRNKDMPKSKEFYIKLRTAVINELESNGFCELVDAILEGGGGRLDIVVYSVLADIAFGYENDKLIDVENDRKYKEYIPYITGEAGGLLGGLVGLSWSKCLYRGQYTVLSDDELMKIIRKARQDVRMRHLQSMNSKNDSDRPANVSINTVQEKQIAEEANLEANRIIDVKKIEADRILEAAKINAKKIIDDAINKKKKMEEEATQEAERIINDSRIEAERICNSAKMSANAIIEDANNKAKEKAQESADRLVDKYLASEQKQFKGELNDELSRYSADLLESSKRAATTHAEMCNATNALQAKWIQTLDDALDQMAAVKAEFYGHIHKWQASVFHSEIKPLAERYLELYRIINVDKLIREAILFNTDSNTDDELNQNIDETESNAIVGEGCPDTVIAGLQKLNKTLTTFLRRFETALNGLDLYVFYPNAGEEFDDMWHLPDDEEDYRGKHIKECVVPGIAKKANDDFGDDVIIPAVVKVEMES